jgi:hypothetical protein
MVQRRLNTTLATLRHEDRTAADVPTAAFSAAIGLNYSSPARLSHAADDIHRVMA